MLLISSKATAVTRNLTLNLLCHCLSERCVMFLSAEQRWAHEKKKKKKKSCCVISNGRGRMRAGPSLKRDSRRRDSSLPQRASGNPGKLLQASAPGHGGSYSLSKSLKWKRNVTGDFTANGVFRWIKQLPKIAIFFFSCPQNISLCKCLFNNQNSTDSIFSQLGDVV